METQIRRKAALSSRLVLLLQTHLVCNFCYHEVHVWSRCLVDDLLISLLLRLLFDADF